MPAVIAHTYNTSFIHMNGQHLPLLLSYLGPQTLRINNFLPTRVLLLYSHVLCRLVGEKLNESTESNEKDWVPS